MSERWSVDDVRALAPDASSWKAARTTSEPAAWPEAGALTGDAPAVWGEYRKSAGRGYAVTVRVAPDEPPAARCTCPSRKTPCKHALGLLHRWAEGTLPETGDPPEWVRRRIARRPSRRSAPAAPDPARAEATRLRRDRAVAEGLAELSLWLRDQIESGLADVPGRGYEHWDRMAKRLVDAKAPGAAALVSDLPSLARERDWPARVLERLAHLHLLAEAHRAREHVPDTLAAAVRTRLGVTTRTDEVLAHGERITDTWTVLGRWETVDRVSDLMSRRVWLRGHEHGRTVMTLVHGRDTDSLEGGLRPGTRVEAELALYPDGLRAVEVRTGPPSPAPPPPGTTVSGALDAHAETLARDPWAHATPVVLADAVPAREGQDWYLADPTGRALPLAPPDPWRLLAATGAHPATVVGEWSHEVGLRLMTVWPGDAPAVVL